MHHSTKAPTKAEQRRFDAMLQIGCVACLLNGHPFTPGEIHHLLSGGRRIGHSATACLCAGHHRGVFEGRYADWSRDNGPSLAKEPRKFRETFGSDSELLEIQNALIEPIIGDTTI